MGVDADGWLSRHAALSLAGGRTAALEIHGEVPAVAGQSLAVLVDGRQIDTQPLSAGSLDLRLLVPAREGNRRIELRFAKDVKLEKPDHRVAAARLASIAVRPVTSAPTALDIPAALTRRNVITTGVFADGWIGAKATLVLAGGKAGDLVLHAEVPATKAGVQRLTVLVNGDSVFSDVAPTGNADVNALVPASAGVRQVELRWTHAARLSAADPRLLSARLVSIAVEPLHGSAELRFPLSSARQTVTSGVETDGWAHQDARVVLAGGPTAAVRIEALTLTSPQRVTILVDGDRVATAALARGTSTLNVPVAASSAARIVELRFGRVARISSSDPRTAAALLRLISVEPVRQGAPRVLQLPADLKRPGLAYTGIYADGWAERSVRVVLAGGPSTMLSVHAQTLTSAQRMTVYDGSRRLGSAAMPAGNDVVRVRLAASATPRLVELRFAKVAPIAANDDRPAATLLRKISLARAAAASHPASSSGRMRALLTAGAEVPPGTGDGSGTLTATLNGKTLSWRLRVTNLSGRVIAAVIRAGKEGHNGPRMLYLCSPCSDDASGTVELTASQTAQIRAGGTYVNVGTVQTPFGEIRGQLTAR